MPRAFVIRPFGKKKDSGGSEIDFERVHSVLIGQALDALRFTGSTTGEMVEAGNIREDMFQLIVEADVVICDITVHNANVFYELGIRHALRKKSTILLKGTPTVDATPFDLLTDRYFSYDVSAPEKQLDALIVAIRGSLVSERPTDSPVFQLMPLLREVDVATVQVVPLDFREEVERALAARSRGWLRLLASEVRSRRFGVQGMKVVGRAQWDLQDWDGASATWEAVRDIDAADIDANLALANVYERQSRDGEKRDELLERSNHAIERVLTNPAITRNQRAEALALSGRNQKTQWRLKFEQLGTLQERRGAAMSRALIRSYNSYRGAFLADLNSYWPGLAAVQMGTILVSFADAANWNDVFDSDADAQTFKNQLIVEVPRMVATVRTSIAAEISRFPAQSPDRMWLDISAADALFLDENAREARVVGAYVSAIPPNKPFAWNAARGQLELFASLGIKVALAQRVMSAVSENLAASSEKPKQPVHLIVVAGHQIDAPDRPLPRFPAASESKARRLLGDRLRSVVRHGDITVALASAAPGTDILGHEVCIDLGIETWVCLPMPTGTYAALVFGGLDNWRSRFLDLMALRKNQVMELASTAGLPRWLEGSGANPWERGNRWVTEIVRAWGADRVTLIALWDGTAEGDAKGGTAHMVQLARDTGMMRIEIIDAKQLLD